MKKISNRIISAAIEGDIEAIDKIIDYYSQLSYYFCFKILKNQFDAEDCSQRALSKLLRNLKKFDESKTDFNTFVYMIVENVALNYKTVDDRYKNKIEINEDYVYSYCDYNNDNLDLQWQLSTIEKLVGEVEYKILLLKIGHNFKFTEIAQMLNMSVSKVKHSYYNSLDKVHEYVKGNYEKK